MSIVYGPNVGLMAGAADGDLYGDAMRAFQRGVDALVMPVVKGVGTNTPPGSPADGDAYVVGTSPTGAWAAKNNQIARWSSVANAWEFYVPKAGWKVQDSSATGQPSYTFTGSAWTTLITTSGGINFGQTDLKNYQEGTWTPSDASGAGLSLTAITNSCKYTRIGRKVVCSFAVAYPTNASGAAAKIGGLPFTVNGVASSGGFVTYCENGSTVTMLAIDATTTFELYAAGGASITNSGMSGKALRGIIEFFV